MSSHTLKDWIIATRPWSFPASAMPVMVTVFYMWMSDYEVNWLLGLWALINIVIVHGAGNVWSDIADYRSGVDATDTFGVRTLVDGQFTVTEFQRLSAILNIIAVSAGIALVLLTGLPLLWIGLTGIALSLAYPWLKYHALGDVVIILCYAVLPMLGTSFIVTGTPQVHSLLLAVPVGLITVAILHANNVRDIETDSRVGISTFPQLTGRRLGVWLYCFEALFPFLWLTGLVIFGLVSWPMLLALLALPIAIKNVKTISAYRQGISIYARLDEQTAQLQLMFSLLLIVGMVISTLWLP
ncbi:MAG: prenyltransferase [Bacteroidaceae bacterium]|nr:prenyltransferase [Bacteroidaceae bacterium]